MTMKINQIKSERIGDTYYQMEHPTGLKIFVYPKENSHSTYAVFGSKYGSIDNCFQRSDENKVQKVPEGNRPLPRA